MQKVKIEFSIIEIEALVKSLKLFLDMIEKFNEIGVKNFEDIDVVSRNIRLTISKLEDAIVKN